MRLGIRSMIEFIRLSRLSAILAVVAIVVIVPRFGWTQEIESDQIDASDPTKIYTYAGGGLKYNEYTNGEYMIEARAIGNVGLSEDDMVLFEFGYGWHQGDLVPGDDNALTNIRLRYFHVMSMDRDVVRGYRGTTLSLDVQLQGELKGTDGQTVIGIGLMPVYGFSEEWNLYLTFNGILTANERMSDFTGAGAGVNAQFIYSNDDWWPGAQVRIIPDYKYIVSGDLDGEGDGTLELNVGGEFTPTVMWDVTGEINFDEDFHSLQRGVETGLKNDWNVFFNVTTYF